MTRTILYTAFALLAFAFNSILCRLALRGGAADASGFTVVRLASGALTLLLITFFAAKRQTEDTSLPVGPKGSWASAFYLFAYAICFSLAYLGLTAGTGALILFGAVQITMIAIAIYRGERPPALEWIGVLVALGGLIYLVLPGLESPPLIGSILMGAAGAAWGIYSIRGRGSKDPLGDTTGNFVRSLPFAIVAFLAAYRTIDLSRDGVLYAVLSGAVTSGIGYTVWYAALKHHTATRAAVLQLLVPIIAAFAAVFMLNESLSMRLVIAAVLVIGGIGLAIAARMITVSTMRRPARQ